MAEETKPGTQTGGGKPTPRAASVEIKLVAQHSIVFPRDEDGEERSYGAGQEFSMPASNKKEQKEILFMFENKAVVLAEEQETPEFLSLFLASQSDGEYGGDKDAERRAQEK